MNVKSVIMGAAVGVLTTAMSIGAIPEAVAKEIKTEQAPQLDDVGDCQYPITDPRYWLCLER